MLSEIIGYIIGLTIGAVMGLIGGGGSLLGPMFIYLLEKPATEAAAYTMLLVGVTALIGVIPRIRRKEVDFPTVIALGTPILAGTMLTTFWLTHLMVDDQPLFTIGTFEVTKKVLLLLLFAGILLLSFLSMKGIIGKNLTPRPDFRTTHPKRYFSILIGAGTLIGLLTGFIGAGGGVMVVPLLVLVVGIPVRTVVGTSLAIMAGKSLIGFLGYVSKNPTYDWQFLAVFAMTMIVGITIGNRMSHRISNERLKSGFAWFILAMAIFIIVNELIIAPIWTD